METALDCVAKQLPACVVLDGSRYFRLKFCLCRACVWASDWCAATRVAEVAPPSKKCAIEASLLSRFFLDFALFLAEITLLSSLLMTHAFGARAMQATALAADHLLCLSVFES